MIAANYRRFPEAMALQLVLIFGRCTWHTARPTTRLGRAQRAERSRLVKETPQIVRWIAKAVPVWWRLAQKAARALAKAVRADLLPLVWDLMEPAREISVDDRVIVAVGAEIRTRYWGEIGTVYLVSRGRCGVVFDKKGTQARFVEPSDLELYRG